MSSLSLYKYYPINEFTYDVIKTGRIWMSDPSHFNDPYDCALSLDMKSYHKRNSDFYSMVSDVMSGKRDKRAIPMDKPPIPGWVMNVANKEFKDEQRKFGVCCFSETNLSILMWSHYADNHKGVCIEFEFPDDSQEKSDLSKVNYRNEFPQFVFEDFRHISKDDVQKKIRQLVTVKAKDWEYEKEWRLIHVENNVHYPKALKINSVLLGVRCDLNVKHQIISLLKEHSCNFYQAELEYNSFNIVYH